MQKTETNPDHTLIADYEKGRKDTIKEAMDFCVDNNILKDFLTNNTAKIMDMMFSELSMEDLRDACYEKGREAGRKKAAHNALDEGCSLEIIQKITGLDMEAIKHIQAGEIQ